MKKILVLGAGIYQVPLIETAKRMGFYTIVASIKGNYPGFQLADRIYYEDTTDYKKILEIARKEQISAILTTGTDVAMISVGYVCDHMNLRGIHYEAALSATDKANMKEKFIRHDVNTAQYYKVYNEEELYSAYDNLRKPVILKVVDKSGSRGIMKVTDKAQLHRAYQEILPVTDKAYILIEEFIDGIEFGIDAFIIDKQLKFILPHEKIVFQNGDTAVPLGHIFPFHMSETQRQGVHHQVQKVCEALALDNCAINIDAFLYDDDIYIIEAGARAGATGIPELISGYIGRDYYEMMILAALGEDIACLIEEHGYWMSQILISEKTGIIEHITLPDVSDGVITLDYQVNDHVTKFKNGPDRIGQIILHADTREAVCQKMNELVEHIAICVKA